MTSRLFPLLYIIAPFYFHRVSAYFRPHCVRREQQVTEDEDQGVVKLTFYGVARGVLIKEATLQNFRKKNFESQRPELFPLRFLPRDIRVLSQISTWFTTQSQILHFISLCLHMSSGQWESEDKLHCELQRCAQICSAVLSDLWKRVGIRRSGFGLWFIAHSGPLAAGIHFITEEASGVSHCYSVSKSPQS